MSHSEFHCLPTVPAIWNSQEPRVSCSFFSQSEWLIPPWQNWHLRTKCHLRVPGGALHEARSSVALNVCQAVGNARNWGFQESFN